MSGGSFNYLYVHSDCSNILEHSSDIYNLKKYLLELADKNNFNVDDICEDLDHLNNEIIKIEHTLPDEFAKFSNIFKNVEWQASGDSGIEDVKKAIEKYRIDNYKIRSEPYVLCDGCNSKIYLGDNIVQFEGLCGIYCSDECFANSHGKFNILTEEEAENCGHKLHNSTELLQEKERLQKEIDNTRATLNTLNLELSKVLKSIK